MTNNSVIDYFNKKLTCFFDRIRDRYPVQLYEAMIYYIFSSGKRIRPTLMLNTAKILGIDEEKVINFAIATEIIHTYSLIHDDLPCMDNDDYRRGKLTCHKVFGEALAVLAGDSLLNLAYELLFSTCDDKNSIMASKFLSECAGSLGMVVGQGMEFCYSDFDERELLDLYTAKTAKLIIASIQIPFILKYGRISQELDVFASNLGLIFQLTDDILDEGEKNGYLHYMGKEKTLSKIQELKEEALINLGKLEFDTSVLVAFLNKIVVRTR